MLRQPCSRGPTEQQRVWSKSRCMVLGGEPSLASSWHRHGGSTCRPAHPLHVWLHGLALLTLVQAVPSRVDGCSQQEGVLQVPGHLSGMGFATPQGCCQGKGHPPTGRGACKVVSVLFKLSSPWSCVTSCVTPGICAPTLCRCSPCSWDEACSGIHSSLFSVALRVADSNDLCFQGGVARVSHTGGHPRGVCGLWSQPSDTFPLSHLIIMPPPFAQELWMHVTARVSPSPTACNLIRQIA
jgi:hypothetical protein